MVINTLHVWLENAYSHHKIEVLGVWPVKWTTLSTIPKGTSWGNTSYKHVFAQLTLLSLPPKKSWVERIIRPHRSTMYVDAAYSYRPSSMVCWSVCHTSERCKNGCIDRAAVWVEDLGLPGNHALDRVKIPSWEGANFWERMGVPL